MYVNKKYSHSVRISIEPLLLPDVGDGKSYA